MTRIRNLAIWSKEPNVDIELPVGAKVHRSNPRLWDGVIKASHDAVYAPDYPHIEAAYEAAGKVVYRPKGDSQPKQEKPAEEPVVAEEEEIVEETPWRELPWPIMRSKATEFTEEPIKNKDMAIEVLEKAEQEGKL